MVRDLHRARVFLERRLREWEVDTLKLGTRTLSQLSPAHIKQVVAVWIRKPATLLMVLLLAVVAIAMRKTLFGEPLAAGGIWPFPSPTRSLITEYLAGWRDVGVGTSSAAPASFPILWLVGLLSFGRERLAQALLVAGATGIGVVGMWRFVAKRTALSWAKLAAVAVYLLGMGHRTMVETADLGALALFAGAPFIADIVFRMLGSTPGEDGDRASTPLTTDAMTREAVRLGLVAAPLVALGPSALIALGFFFLVVWLHTLGVAWDRGEVVRRARWLLAALGITIAVLIPWSLEGLRPSGAILGPIFSGFGGGDSYRPLWSDSGFLSLILLNPARSARPLFAAAVPVTLALGAVALSSPSRRREGRLLLSMWLAFGLVGGAASKGWIPAPVASPAMWMAFPLAASAALAGHFLVGLKQELPRHVLGWRHVASAVVAVVVAAGFALGWAPGLAGWQRPGSTLAAPAGDLARSINSFFISNAETVGEFRILWLGDEWVDPVRPAVRRMEGTQYFVTGEGGLTMLDAHDPSPVEGERRLDAIVEALAARQLHQAGHLLAPASIRYIVVDTNDESMMSAMARQRDIGLEHQQSEIAVFRNLQWLPRAALIPPGLGSVAGSEVRDDRALMLAEWVGGRRIPGESDTSFRGELPRTHHAAILIGDNFNAGWRATAGGRSLEHTAAFGWANQFDLPQGTSGEVRVSYSRRWVRIIWLVLQIWVVTMAVAMTRVSGGVRGSVR